MDQKEEINIQSKQNEDTRMKIMGGARGEEGDQEIENLLEQIVEENLPNLVKEIDFQEAQRVPKKLDPKRNTPRHIIIKLPRLKIRRES